MSLNRKMSDAHEEHLAEVYGGRVMPGSGNQSANPMDVRQHRYDAAVALAIDGKSTRAKSLSITREMLTKAREQAHGERPAIAVRFYDDDRLRSYDDWMLLQEDDLLELLDRSARLRAIEEAGCLGGVHDFAMQPSGLGPGIEAANGPCVGCGHRPYEAAYMGEDG